MKINIIIYTDISMIKCDKSCIHRIVLNCWEFDASLIENIFRLFLFYHLTNSFIGTYRIKRDFL